VCCRLGRDSAADLAREPGVRGGDPPRLHDGRCRVNDRALPTPTRKGTLSRRARIRGAGTGQQSARGGKQPEKGWWRAPVSAPGIAGRDGARGEDSGSWGGPARDLPRARRPRAIAAISAPLAQQRGREPYTLSGHRSARSCGRARGGYIRRGRAQARARSRSEER